ncbi:MAG: flavodoxin [Clostridia bacterium]|nr:flavodoxin [Clostridia bacterium]
MWTALFVLIGLLVLVAGSAGIGFSIMKRGYGARPEILKAASGEAVKALVVYQPSVTSASSDVAHSIAKGLNEAGAEVTLDTPGDHLSSDISGYSIVVFGSPNYGGSPAQPMLDYLNRIDDFSGRQVLLFSTSGSAEGRLEFDKMEALLHGVKPENTLKIAAAEVGRNMDAAYRFGADAVGR